MKVEHRGMCVCVIPELESSRQGDLGVCWPASLPYMASSRISERCYLQRKRQKRGGQRRMTSGFHTQMHTRVCMPYGWTCTHIHTHAHIHVYTHTHTCVYTHTYTYTYTHTRTCACMHIHSRVRAHTHRFSIEKRKAKAKYTV